MSSLDLTPRLSACYNTQQRRPEALEPLLGGLRLLVVHVFIFPEVEKSQEQAEITTFEVQQQVGQTAPAIGLSHCQRLFIYHQKTGSSKAAIRLPCALALIGEINDLKAQLAKLITVESQLPPEQCFDFVHRHLRGLKTLSAYRGLQLITDPDSVRFGLANE